MKVTEPTKSTATARHHQEVNEEQKPFFQGEKAGNVLENGQPGFFFTSGNGAIQRKPFFNKPIIQTKLAIGQPGDKYEQEADTMANQVVQRLTENKNSGKIKRKTETRTRKPAIQRKPIFESEAETPGMGIQAKRIDRMPLAAQITPFLQLQEEEEQVQAKESGPLVAPGNDIEARLQSTKGNGQPMDNRTRQEMESGFGVDFSGIRIHTGSSAVMLSKDLGAQAFTHGSDIYFNSGKYDPGSGMGKQLLAHELTHTVQQGATERLKPDLLLQDEEDVDLEKELAASEQDAIDAIDPGPALETREEAEKEKTEAEIALAEQAVESEEAVVAEGEPSTEAGETVAEPTEKSVPGAVGTGRSTPARAVTPETVTEPMGQVGQDLENTSAGVCDEAAQKARVLAENEKTHDEAGKKLEQAESAVVSPEEEGESQSSAAQVEAVEKAEEPQTDQAAMDSVLTQAVADSVPSTIEEMNAFKSGGKAKVIGNKVLAESSRQVGEIKGTYSEIENVPSAPAPEPAVPLPEQELAPETPELNLGQGAVPGLEAEHTDFSEFEEKSDNLLEKEGISEEQLEMVDSGELAEAKAERKDLKQQVESKPAEVQAFAVGKQEEVEGDMLKEEQQAKDEMEQKRKDGLGETQGRQVEAKSAMELKREEVTQNIIAIYERAKTSVTTKLEQLEQDALSRFDQGQAAASLLFEQEVERDINAWKRERYSGLFAGVKWLRDLLLGIDDFPEVKNAFERARARYIERIDQLIVAINEENNRVIQECKDELAQAKVEIKEYVNNLGPELRDTGQKAMEDMQQKLAEMDSFIDRKKEELQQKLCDRKEQAIKAIDKKIEQMKEAMSGALSKLGNLLLNALIKFFTWALNKIGSGGEQVMGIVNKGKSVIKKIAGDPIGFFKNIGKAVGGGIRLFVDNIKQHLIKGLMSWLTGAMGDAGITLPDKFDLKGILSIVLQIANLTWTAIRTKLVKKAGEKVVSAAEKGVDIFKRVIAEGPIAIWNIVKEKAVELKEQVLEGIRNWAIFEIVKKATIKLISMLNPAGAIFQAIMALYDVVMFFIENWNRIVTFVQSVFSSVAEIAMGQIGKAAAFIEKALAQTIPIILSFLARFLGLSGIGKAIARIISKIRKPIDMLIDKIVEFLAKQVKKLFGGGKKGNKAVEDAGGDPRKAQKVQAGLADIDKEEQKYLKTGKEISKEDADKVTRTVKLKHPIFKSITVIDGHETWDYEYVASPSKRKKGEKQVKDDAGTQNNPFEITWPKPPSSKYEPLYLGGVIGKPRSQSILKGLFTRRQNDETGNPVKKYISHGSHSLQGGHSIGISPHYQISTGKIIGPLSQAKTPGGKKLNNILKKYGFMPESEGKDADHVWEIQFGGKDLVENLWPLDSVINSTAGSTLKSLTITYPKSGKQAKITELKSRTKKYYFKITKFSY